MFQELMPLLAQRILLLTLSRVGVSYAIGQGATMVSALWGVFIWKEFVSAPPASRKLIPAMFIFFLLGLGSIAIAPMVTR